MSQPTPIAQVIAAGAWTQAPVDQVLLDYNGRHRRRIVLHGAAGSYLLDLPETAHLHDGDGLALADGRIVAVVAEPEPLLEVRAETPAMLTRLAWHIGNRHLTAAIGPDFILIRRDHVIAHMLEHLGATVREVTAVFDPEGGAYHDHAH